MIYYNEKSEFFVTQFTEGGAYYICRRKRVKTFDPRLLIGVHRVRSKSLSPSETESEAEEKLAKWAEKNGLKKASEQ